MKKLLLIAALALAIVPAASAGKPGGPYDERDQCRNIDGRQLVVPAGFGQIVSSDGSARYCFEL